MTRLHRLAREVLEAAEASCGSPEALPHLRTVVSWWVSAGRPEVEEEERHPGDPCPTCGSDTADDAPRTMDATEPVLRLTRERDEARRAVAALNRELHRWQHGEEIESDYICQPALEAQAEIDRMRPVVEAAEAWRDAYADGRSDDTRLHVHTRWDLATAVDRYRAARDGADRGELFGIQAGDERLAGARDADRLTLERFRAGLAREGWQEPATDAVEASIDFDDLALSQRRYLEDGGFLPHQRDEIVDYVGRCLLAYHEQTRGRR